jgi:hypothetical protein
MDLSVGIAIGPVCRSHSLSRRCYSFPIVWQADEPRVFAAGSLAAVASVYTCQISGDGETNRIEGVQLLPMSVPALFYLPAVVSQERVRRLIRS